MVEYINRFSITMKYPEFSSFLFFLMVFFFFFYVGVQSVFAVMVEAGNVLKYAIVLFLFNISIRSSETSMNEKCMIITIYMH